MIQQDQRQNFTPFVLSADGLLAYEAVQFVRRLSSLLADHWQQPYSVVCGWIRARLSIAAVCATHLTLCGSRIPSSKISQRRFQWEDGAGLGLHRMS